MKKIMLMFALAGIVLSTATVSLAGDDKDKGAKKECSKEGKSCCKKEGSAKACSKSEAKACCKKDAAAEGKSCSGHEKK